MIPNPHPELKPSISYRDTLALSSILYAEVGLDVGYAVNPHNAGMHYHDQTNAVDFAHCYTKDNIILQKGMIINIVVPFLDVDLGTSAYL